MREKNFKFPFTTHPRKIIPQTEVIDALGQAYFSEYNDAIEEHTFTYWPFVNEGRTAKWAIDRAWAKYACETHSCLEDTSFTDAEKKQCLQEEVQRVVEFLVELHEWCRLNQLPLPEDCDPNKWDMIPDKQREAIIEGLAANGVGTVFDPFDL